MSEFLTKQFAFCVSPSLEKPFPYVYAMVVYNGKEAYNYSTYLKDMIRGPSACIDNLFGKGFDLLDLYRTDDKQFMQFLRSGLMCRFMKHIHDNDILPFIRHVLLDLHELLTTTEVGDGKLVKGMLNYVILRGQISDKEAFRSLIMENLGESGEKVLMTYAEWCKQEWLQEGRQEGRQEGWQEGCQAGLEKGKLEIITTLRSQFSPEIIAKMINQPVETVLQMLGEQ